MSEFGDKCQVGKTCHWCGEYEVSTAGHDSTSEGSISRMLP